MHESYVTNTCVVIEKYLKYRETTHTHTGQRSSSTNVSLEVDGIVLYTSPENTPKFLFLLLLNQLCVRTRKFYSRKIKYHPSCTHRGLEFFQVKKSQNCRGGGGQFFEVFFYTERLKCAGFGFMKKIKTVFTRLMIMCVCV